MEWHTYRFSPATVVSPGSKVSGGDHLCRSSRVGNGIGSCIGIGRGIPASGLDRTWAGISDCTSADVPRIH